MMLYHGTALKHLPKILKEGLKPRGKKGITNWKHSIESNPDTIYLTNAYALYFAYQAAPDGEDAVVVEIDTVELNPMNLVPDEDFLEQATRKGNGPAPIEKSMKYRTRWYRRRIRGFQEYWKDSVNGLGTCGYMGEIPASAITRYAIIPNMLLMQLIFQGMDPFISIMNYRIVGDKYRNWVRWVFDDPLEGWAEDVIASNPDNAELLAASAPDYMKKISREGIVVEVVS